MKITKSEFAMYLVLTLIAGWVFGRITEAIALGNI